MWRLRDEIQSGTRLSNCRTRRVVIYESLKHIAYPTSSFCCLEQRLLAVQELYVGVLNDEDSEPTLGEVLPCISDGRRSDEVLGFSGGG